MARVPAVLPTRWRSGKNTTCTISLSRQKRASRYCPLFIESFTFVLTRF